MALLLKQHVDYHLSFADQDKKTSVFRLQKTNESVPFLFSVFSK
jgi:hypothetical protein